jgi:hypothetical protein
MTTTLLGYVRDILAVENELHGAFRRQKRDERTASAPAAAEFVARTEQALDRHLAHLRGILERRGASESTLKSALGTVLGAAAGVYDRLRPEDPISRALRDDYTALSFAAICYEMLHTTALAADDGEIAGVALAHLRDYAPLIVELAGLLPHVVVGELAAEGKIAADERVAERAARNTREAWMASSP